MHIMHYIYSRRKKWAYLFLFLLAGTNTNLYQDPFRPDRCWTTPRPPIHRLWRYSYHAFFCSQRDEALLLHPRFHNANRGRDPDRQTPAHGTGGHQCLRQVRKREPRRERQGPTGTRGHRVGREGGISQARPDGGRGLLGEHWHRTGHGLRRAWISTRRRNVGILQHRAEEADALPRGQGCPYQPR